jgi:hypothetical protein
MVLSWENINLMGFFLMASKEYCCPLYALDGRERRQTHQVQIGHREDRWLSGTDNHAKNQIGGRGQFGEVDGG